MLAARLLRTTPAALTAVPRRAASTVAGAAAKKAARPLSPHLTIYKFGDNMITSVFFRGTGVFLMGGLAACSIAYLAADKPYHYYLYQLQQYPILNALVKAGVAFPLTYHFLGGLRHLAWDNVHGQNVQFVKKTGLGALGVASAVTLIAMVAEKQPKKARK